jgi:hypothetical protein
MSPHRAYTVLGIVAVALLYAFDPATTVFFPSCPIRLLTGWSCPGCGTLRALHALLHGRLGDALHDNALTVSLLPTWAAAGIFGRLRIRRARGAFTAMTSPAAAAGLFMLALLFGVVRNIPLRPFLWLVP